MAEQRNQEAVGRLVNERRRELALSSAALADLANVDAKTLRSLERGQRWPQDANRAKIEQALGWIPGALDALLAGVATDQVGQEDEESEASSRTRFAPTSSPLRDLRRIGRILGLETGYFAALNDQDARPVLAALTIAFHNSGLQRLAAHRRNDAAHSDSNADLAEYYASITRDYGDEEDDSMVNTAHIDLPADAYGLAASRGPSKGKAMKREMDAAGEESQDSGSDEPA